MKTLNLQSITFILLVLFLSSCADNFGVSNIQDDYVETEPNVTHPKLLSLINTLRAEGCQCGNTYYPPVGALEWDNRVADAAKDHSSDMKDNNYFSHTGLDGSDAGTRIARTGYTWLSFGENIGKGNFTEDTVFDAWLNSPTHCKVMMNSSFTEMGIGVDGQYWTQNFAKPIQGF